ncbi:MAG: hypothetical protein J7518_22090 [Nocardioidaceae bacterium]|nr:hypothetical protein [Nocardioidaceae bacterium]
MTLPPGRDIRSYRASFLGIGLLACTAFLIFGTWPLYGAAGALPLFALWLVLLVLGCRWFASRPSRVLVVGALAMLAWLAVVLAHR